MNRLLISLSYTLIVVGVLALLGGLLSLNLTPLVLGGILVGLGGILLLLVRLERRLTEALPALSSLSQTARFIALKESPRASVVESESAPGSAGVRDGTPGPVGTYPASSSGGAARA